jgi:peptidoglycan lytic transglycosylase G
VVIRRLLDQFGTEAESLPWADAEELGVTPYEVVIIASMIEREAALDRERPIIAGVIYNRLKLGMTLGIDATLLYDDPTPDGQLSFSDLEYDSPYNTRINAGLPPTPIASPGRASLEAALQPADTPYLFYVLCGEDGHHAFGVTIADHEANRVRCDE